MALNFRRSIKVAPGVRISLSKKGLGLSAGARGARISQSATGRTTLSTGIPGSGISYRKTLKSKKRNGSNPKNPSSPLVNQMNDLQITKPAVEREIVLEPKKPRKFWTGFWVLTAIGSFGAIFDTPTANGPSRLSSINFALFTLLIVGYRIYRHKNPRMRQVVRILDENS